jgi:hypothetical protein
VTPLQHEYLLALFGAYTGLFIIMFGFMYRMLQKSRKLDHDVKLLKEEWIEQPEAITEQGDANSAVMPTVRGQGMQDA